MPVNNVRFSIVRVGLMKLQGRTLFMAPQLLIASKINKIVNSANRANGDKLGSIHFHAREVGSVDNLETFFLTLGREFEFCWPCWLVLINTLCAHHVYVGPVILVSQSVRVSHGDRHEE